MKHRYYPTSTSLPAPSRRHVSRVRGGRRAQGGFTLIEVMVSVLILLVGLLGVVGMQMLSLQTNQGAYFRSQAVYIAAEILDAMRANPTAVANYVGTYPVDGGGANTVPADPGCQGATGCTPAQAAQQDLHFWARHLADVDNLVGATYKPSIPNGRVVIAATGNPNEFSVQVNWTERQFDNTDATDGSATRSNVQQIVNLTAVITP
jgi:type IV pilus assembly protein PilV